MPVAFNYFFEMKIKCQIPPPPFKLSAAEYNFVLVSKLVSLCLIACVRQQILLQVLCHLLVMSTMWGEFQMSLVFRSLQVTLHPASHCSVWTEPVSVFRFSSETRGRNTSSHMMRQVKTNSMLLYPCTVPQCRPISCAMRDYYRISSALLS